MQPQQLAALPKPLPNHYKSSARVDSAVRGHRQTPFSAMALRENIKRFCAAFLFVCSHTTIIPFRYSRTTTVVIFLFHLVGWGLEVSGSVGTAAKAETHLRPPYTVWRTLATFSRSSVASCEPVRVKNLSLHNIYQIRGKQDATRTGVVLLSQKQLYVFPHRHRRRAIRTSSTARGWWRS